MSDALAELGLDAKQFKTEVNAVNAHLKSLEGEEESVNAQVALLEKNMRLAGKATGAQVAQLGKLRQALKAIRGDIAEVSRGKDALAAVDPNAPKDDAGKEGGSSALKIAGVTLSIAAVVSALKRLGQMALETGDRINAARDKFAEGDRLNTRTGGVDPVVSEVLDKRVDDALEGIKNKAGGEFSKVMSGALAIKDVRFGENGLDLTKDAKEKLQTELAAGRELDEQRKRKKAIEIEIADLEKGGTMEADKKRQILEKQQELAEAQLAIADNILIKDQQGINQAKEAIGQKMDAIQAQRAANLDEIRAAATQTEEIGLQQNGMKGIADQLAIREDYEGKILKAQREGKTELAEQLELQKQLKLNAAAVDEHNLTPAQLRSERSAARKFARDEKKADAQNRDLEIRAARARSQHDTPTPGSRLARFMQAQESRKRIENVTRRDMGVALMNVTQMKVTEMKVMIP